MPTSYPTFIVLLLVNTFPKGLWTLFLHAFLLHFVMFAFCVTCAKTHIYVFCICQLLYLVTQSCPALCDPMDCSPPGSSVHGNSPGENNWSGLPCPTLRTLPNPGIEPRSPILQSDSLPPEPSGKPIYSVTCQLNCGRLWEIICA